MDISPATELSDYLDSHFHGNDKEDRGNDRGETDIGIEDVNDLCPQCGGRTRCDESVGVWAVK